MKICITEEAGAVNVVVDAEFHEKPWLALDFIADAIARLQGMALDVEASAEAPSATD